MTADRDTVKFWLDAAGRYPVLKPDQVLMLAQQVQSNPPGSKLHKRAVEKLVRHNLKLIPRLARRAMRNKHGNNFGGTYTEDVFQSGVIGLTRAAELYDPKRGYAFSTYANAWIFQAIQRDLYNNMSLIRIPENTIREYYSVYKNCKTIEEIKEMPAKKVARYRDAAIAMGCLSIDMGLSKTIDADGPIDMSSVIKDPKGKELTDTIQELVDLSRACQKSKEMVIAHFEEGLTLKQVSAKFDVTKSQASRMIRNCLTSIKENMTAI